MTQLRWSCGMGAEREYWPTPLPPPLKREGEIFFVACTQGGSRYATLPWAIICHPYGVFDARKYLRINLTEAISQIPAAAAGSRKTRQKERKGQEIIGIKTAGLWACYGVVRRSQPPAGMLPPHA